MSWALYMNMEALSIKIAKSHVALMTNDNSEDGDDIYLDEKVFLNNIENGFVVITQLNCYIESFLNAIINSCIGYTEEALLKCNHQEKIDIIFLHYSKDFSAIKSKKCWESYRTTTKVRNEMIHFKKPYIGHSSHLMNFKLGGKHAGDFFTKDNIQRLLDDHILLAKEIAKAVDLIICDEVDVFTNQGSGEETNYIRTKQYTDRRGW